MKKSFLRLGCDPEFFIRQNGRVIGSEDVLGSGLMHIRGSVIKDGVQAEINPLATNCRETMIYNIRACLDMVAHAMGTDMSINTSVSVEIERNMFESLSEDCRKFGCKPSFNLDPEVPEVMLLNASDYMIRSAGGHIHLGGDSGETLAVLKNPKLIMPLLDLIVGNTCVLLDRDEGNIERRKHYGRAGEFRTPSYGIEYRTLSNFWLRSPVLASLVFGLARHAVDIAQSGMADKFMSLVDYQEVRQAIDNNDFELAKKNFEKIKALLLNTVDSDENFESGRYPLEANTIKGFEELVAVGLDKYFGRDILKNWRNYDHETQGSYYFLMELSGNVPPYQND